MSNFSFDSDTLLVVTHISTGRCFQTGKKIRVDKSLSWGSLREDNVVAPHADCHIPVKTTLYNGDICSSGDWIIWKDQDILRIGRVDEIIQIVGSSTYFSSKADWLLVTPADVGVVHSTYGMHKLKLSASKVRVLPLVSPLSSSYLCR